MPARRERRSRLGAGWVVALVLLSLVAGALGGWGAQQVVAQQEETRRPDGSLPVSVERDPASGELTGVAGIAAAVLPSVVAIEVRGPEGAGTGSGFVLREDGYILTNSHVVSAADGGGGQVVVVFADGSEEPAEIVGRTPEYDLAVIRVDRTGLTPLALADSDAVVVGDPVIAIGAPLGLQSTVTTGIVSALNRPVTAGNQDETAFINAIQTDAAINPGNSGGPLVDADGQVVGINSAIAQPPGLGAAGGSIGLGFAIPSNQARRTAEELIETGRATYPVIGVLLDGTYDGEGVRVATEPQPDLGQPVTPDGPADRAGIRPGDVILEIDGRPVTASDELIVAIRARAPGDAVTLTVRSGEEEREVRVVLDEVASE
ncbi:S1C family serine protease [Actinotalea sp. Marseille-Q4924]|uniref:S1C family serine protease n=1 Tax=Actinotalea sp. Marseille-Q4924 TaxID=2866571 RepID=UPI001CE41B28|nr:trypsin-like peptidase domain-containing protein [Actinotalea sp. Marseille-Q4924]